MGRCAEEMREYEGGSRKGNKFKSRFLEIKRERERLSGWDEDRQRMQMSQERKRDNINENSPEI